MTGKQAFLHMLTETLLVISSFCVYPYGIREVFGVYIHSRVGLTLSLLEANISFNICNMLITCLHVRQLPQIC